MPLRQRSKCPLVALSGARHEVMIGPLVHAGTESAVASRARHDGILPVALGNVPCDREKPPQI
jgi:hypothetical protein